MLETNVRLDMTTTTTPSSPSDAGEDTERAQPGKNDSERTIIVAVDDLQAFVDLDVSRNSLRSRLSILDPTSIFAQVKTRQTGNVTLSTDIRLDLQDVNIRISYEDVMLTLSILASLLTARRRKTQGRYREATEKAQRRTRRKARHEAALEGERKNGGRSLSMTTAPDEIAIDAGQRLKTQSFQEATQRRY